MTKSLQDFNNPNLYNDVCNYIFQNKEKVLKENENHFHNLPSESSFIDDYNLQQYYIDFHYMTDVIDVAKNAQSPEDIKKLSIEHLATLAKEQNYCEETETTLLGYLALSAVNDNPEKAKEINIHYLPSNSSDLSKQNNVTAFKLYNNYLIDISKKSRLINFTDDVESLMGRMRAINNLVDDTDINKMFFDRSKDVYNELKEDLQNDHPRRVRKIAAEIQEKAMEDMLLGYIKAEGSDKSYMGHKLAQVRRKFGTQAGDDIRLSMFKNKITDNNLTLLTKPNYKSLGINPLQKFNKNNMNFDR